MSTLDQQFMNGANFVRQTERDVQQERLANAQNERAQERHNATQKAASLQTQIAADQHREWQGNAGKRETLSNLQLSEAQKEATRRETAHSQQTEAYEANKKRTRTLQSREDTLWKLQQDETQRKQNLQWLQDNSEIELYNLKTKGEMSPEFYARSRGTAFDISRLVDSQYTDQLNFLAAALNPNDPRAAPKDPRFLVSMNTVFKDEINRGLDTSVHPETGSPAINKKIISARPVEGSPGNFYIELEVEYEDGKKTVQPYTKGRGSDPEAELGTVGTGDLVQQVSARKAYMDMIKKSGLDQAYVNYSKTIAQQKANAKNAGNQIVNWNGQQVKAAELYDQYKLEPEQWREGDKEAGIPPLMSFGDYLWTQGDPVKTQILEKVIKRNQEIDLFNQTAEPEDQLQRASVYDVWALMNEGKDETSKGGKGGNKPTDSDDPNAAILDTILDDAPDVDINKVPDVGGGGRGNHDGKGAMPQPTRRVRTPQGAIRQAYERTPKPEPEPIKHRNVRAIRQGVRGPQSAMRSSLEDQS